MRIREYAHKPRLHSLTPALNTWSTRSTLQVETLV